MSNTRLLPSWIAAGLFVQAIAVAAWWALLFIRPELRALFFADQDQRALLPFLVPDLLAYVGLGCVLALTGSRKVAWIFWGAVGYATLYTWGYSLSTGAGWLSAALMTVTFAFALLIAKRLG